MEGGKEMYLLAVSRGLVLLCVVNVFGPAALHVVHTVTLVVHMLGVYAQCRAAESQSLHN